MPFRDLGKRKCSLGSHGLLTVTVMELEWEAGSGRLPLCKRFKELELMDLKFS